jgi:hypothetical protein
MIDYVVLGKWKSGKEFESIHGTQEDAMKTAHNFMKTPSVVKITVLERTTTASLKPIYTEAR